MASKISSQSRSFLDRVKAGVSSSVDISGLSGWLEENTSNPKDYTKPWSFEGHEFQKAILNDTSHRVCVRKCSQVGVTELIIRMVLAMLSVLRNNTAIYTLPTSGFAAKVAKSRIDPVIKSSALLKASLDDTVDNVELKKIGSSFLYILGTFTQGSAISIPADILVNDEVDFSNQQALTTFVSRLGHAREGGLRREFSTPTVNGYGISKTFDTSTQAQYGVVCGGCKDTVFPDFFRDVIIPGYEDELETIEKEDLRDPRYDIQGAFIKCPECGCTLSPERLADPTKRRWVHRFPEREIHGYQIFPYDVPLINPIPKTLKALNDYDRKADWANFKVGVPFEDAESSFLIDILLNNKTVDPVVPPEYGEHDNLEAGHPKGLVMGIDVGKVSWVCVGRPVGRGKLQVIWAERIRQDGQNTLLNRICFLVKWFCVSKAVIDAAPDFSTSMAFVEAFLLGRTFANYYTRSKNKNTLSHINVNEEEGIVTSVRTESFDLLAKKSNAGQLLLPKIAETAIILEHLKAIKRVETTNNQGDLAANWVSTGHDHYAHALNYMNIASTLLDDRFAVSSIRGVLPMAVIAKLKTSV